MAGDTPPPPTSAHGSVILGADGEHGKRAAAAAAAVAAAAAPAEPYFSQNNTVAGFLIARGVGGGYLELPVCGAFEAMDDYDLSNPLLGADFGSLAGPGRLRESSPGGVHPGVCEGLRFAQLQRLAKHVCVALNQQVI